MKVDLQVRLDAITSEMTSIQQRLDHLTNLEQALKLLIADTQDSAKEQLALIPDQPSNGRRPQSIGKTVTSRFILDALRDGQPKSLKAMSDMARAKGIDFQGKNAGRVLHFALIGLARNGYTHMVRRSVWQLLPKALAGENAPQNEGPIENSATVAGR